MRIVAVIGSESHSTSSGWSKLFINGERATHRNAISASWLTKYGDKHASWCECVFEVADGAEVRWEAGANSGSRGADRKRQALIFRADPNAEIMQTEGVGYPASDAVLKGRLVLATDVAQANSQAHNALIADL